MLIRLLAAFIIIPLVELYLLLQVAEATSLGTTLAIVIVTGIIGSILARREGVMAWYRFRSALSQGRVPTQEIQDGLMIVFAAALLLTPGLLTDAVGFALLVPLGRTLARRYVLARYFKRFTMSVTTQRGAAQQRAFHRSTGSDRSTVDAEAVERKSPEKVTY